MNQKENLLGVLQVLLRWRRPILKLCAIAAIGSAAISFFLPNYYRSSTTFYAASTDLFMPEKLFGSSKESMHYYGTNDDIDRLLTIAASNEVVDFLVKKFHLYQHYQIDSTKEKAPFKVKEAFFDLYSVQKTKYDAIELSVEDKDRHLAAQITNTAREKIDEMAQHLIKDNQRKLMTTFEQNMLEKQLDLKRLGDSLVLLRQKYGVYDPITQSELLTTLVAQSEAKLYQEQSRLKILEKMPNLPKDTVAFLRAMVHGLEQRLQSLISADSKSNINLKRFNQGLASVEILTQLHIQERNQLSYDIERYNQLKTAYNSPISAVHLVQTGEVPVVKSSPQRLLIVLISTLATFFFSLIGVLFIENYKDVDWKELTKEG